MSGGTVVDSCIQSYTNVLTDYALCGLVSMVQEVRKQ